MITKCPHQAAHWLLTNEHTRDNFQISMRCSQPISAHNSLGFGFDSGRCTKNASLEKINLLGRMDFSRELWLLQPATVCFGACPIVRKGHSTCVWNIYFLNGWRRKGVVTFFQCVKLIFLTTNERTFQPSLRGVEKE
jgi:hypothetical protein